MGIPPELLAAEAIFRYQKNLLEFCRAFHDDRSYIRDSLHATLDLIQLNVAVFEHLAEERERG